jgi:predicted TIM-barrel fold metal-dependent hydrolase
VSIGVVDCSFHPLMARQGELNPYLEEPWRSRGFSYGFQKGVYRPPVPPYAHGAEPADGSLPASDTNAEAAALTERGIDVAILVPLTSGLMPEVRFDSAIASATNEWLAAKWLDTDVNHGQLKGTIRVCPRDVGAAVSEIERWAEHPHFVQVAVPLEAHVPYGDEVYFPIWEAASSAGLPVAFRSDGWTGVQLPPTGAGYPSYYLEAYTQLPLLAALHFSSMVSEGVLERLPDLRLVFADGGFGLFEPISWRIDRVWRSLRFEVPWLTSPPSTYLHERVRIVLQKADILDDPDRMAKLLAIGDAAGLLLYGSNYPFWDAFGPEEVSEQLPAESRSRILGDNAAQWYGLAA